jgi:hypothetical protein
MVLVLKKLWILILWKSSHLFKMAGATNVPEEEEEEEEEEGGVEEGE